MRNFERIADILADGSNNIRIFSSVALSISAVNLYGAIFKEMNLIYDCHSESNTCCILDKNCCFLHKRKPSKGVDKITGS